MAYPEEQILGKFQNTGLAANPQAANTTWQPVPTLTSEPGLYQGLLNGKQVAEVRRLRVYSPVDPLTGAGDDLSRITLVLDGTEYPALQIDGKFESNVQPLSDRLRGNVREYVFGKPTWDPSGHPNGLTDATCPKYISSVAPKVYAGATAISHDYTIVMLGFIYDATDLAELMPTYNPLDVVIPDVANGRQFVVRGRPIQANGNWRTNWKQLPAGDGQTIQARPSDGQQTSKVLPFCRKSRNLNPILTTQAYEFAYSGINNVQGVIRPEESLYFDLSEDEALVLQRFGVKSPAPDGTTGAQLLAAWIATPSQTQKRHPAGAVDASYYQAELNYGLVTGSKNDFRAVPQLRQGDQLITDEIAYATVQAQTANVAALAVNTTVTGIYVVAGKGNLGL